MPFHQPSCVAVNPPPLARSYGTCNFLDRPKPSCCVLLLWQPRRYETALHCVHTGEARTSAFVERNGGADASFDSFSFDTAASEILLNLVDTYLPQGSPKATALRARAEALRLPSNPLVGAYETACNGLGSVARAECA